jgi:starvation-inducible DNA-binding protein
MVDTLLELLESTFDLYIAATLAHWNVQGPGFFELHKAFRKLYERRQEDLDRIAERVRALGDTIKLLGDEMQPEVDGAKLCRALLDAHEKAAKRTKEACKEAEEAGDVGTSMLLEELVHCLEKDAWMLRSYGRRSP